MSYSSWSSAVAEVAVRSDRRRDAMMEGCGGVFRFTSDLLEVTHRRSAIAWRTSSRVKLVKADVRSFHMTSRCTLSVSKLTTPPASVPSRGASNSWHVGATWPDSRRATMHGTTFNARSHAVSRPGFFTLLSRRARARKILGAGVCGGYDDYVSGNCCV